MTFAEFQATCAQPLDPRWVKPLPEKSALYIPWHHLPTMFGQILPGVRWTFEALDRWTEDIVRKRGGHAESKPAHAAQWRLSFYLDDGVWFVDDVSVDDDPDGQRGTGPERVKGAAFRRCAAAMGEAFGLSLYQKDGEEKARIEAAVAGATRGGTWQQPGQQRQQQYQKRPQQYQRQQAPSQQQPQARREPWDQ